MRKFFRDRNARTNDSSAASSASERLPIRLDRYAKTGFWYRWTNTRKCSGQPFRLLSTYSWSVQSVPVTGSDEFISSLYSANLAGFAAAVPKV
jgi:hypothetical protein